MNGYQSWATIFWFSALVGLAIMLRGNLNLGYMTLQQSNIILSFGALVAGAGVVANYFLLTDETKEAEEKE